jgi:formylglycine-generating enzyme
MNRPTAVTSIAAAVVLVGAAVAIVIRLAERERAEPARCAEGLVATGARCCAAGQAFVNGRCTGVPARCPDGMHLVAGARPGCVATERRISVPGGSLKLGASDWDGQTALEPRELKSAAFQLDAFEVNVERWQVCTKAGVCSTIDEPEPGRPVTNVTAVEARTFCSYAGGRLPTVDEWLVAAAGSAGRRFPWGQTGLVCRRASFGLLDGPCATGATGPELTGSRADGATPEGVLDLSGNVAELVREPNGRYLALGGSYRSKVAAELRSWAAEVAVDRAAHVGFRCAYDAR